MARNRVAEMHNNEYLISIINNGVVSGGGRFFQFNGIDKTGNPKGYIFAYDKETGKILRANANNLEDRQIFGNKENSTDARGYLCVEMCVPYVQGVYPASSFYYDDNGEVVAVQYTCYIQRIVAAIKCKLEGKPLVDLGEANHMTGNKMDNRYFNIEDGTQKDNSIHSAVFNSLLNHRRYFDDLFTTSSNKTHSFTHLVDNRYISSRWIKEYMMSNKQFADAVDDCRKDMRSKAAAPRYISIYKLETFIDWLYSKGYWTK